MHDAAIVAGLMLGEPRFFFDEDEPLVRMPTLEGERRRQTDDPAPDDNHVRLRHLKLVVRESGP